MARLTLDLLNGNAMALFRALLGLPSANGASREWLIFPLADQVLPAPPGENDKHALYFVCEDLVSVTERLRSEGVPCSQIEHRSGVSISSVSFPPGGYIGLLQEDCNGRK
jgi:hypothetical protein